MCLSTSSLPYNPELPPWGNPTVTDLDLCQPWTNREWLTATYCGTAYKYYVYGPPHATRFIGILPRGCCCFTNSKCALGQLICQDEGGLFGVSGV